MLTSETLLNFLRDNRGLPVRSMTIFNFLLEASLCGAILILIVLLVRRFLRGKLGNRAVYFAWLLVAIRLLMPIAIPNPAMNELRPTLSDDKGARPVADQIRVRFVDAMYDVAHVLQPSYSERRSENSYTLARFVQDVGAYTSYGFTGKWFLIGYFVVDGLVLAYMVAVNLRFRRRLKRARVSALDGDALARYREICSRRGVKPLPVYYVDPLPSACLVGVIRPYIALPLTLKDGEIEHVLTHELCHHKAHDEWWGVLRNLCCIVHWFNPLVWVAARCVRTDCEMACDDRVIAPMDDDGRISYANTLVLAAARRTAPRMSVLATGMTMPGKRLKRRVSAIVSNPKVQRWAVISFVAVIMCLTVLAFGTAEDRSNDRDVQLERAKYMWVLDEPFDYPAPKVNPIAAASLQTEAEARDYATRVLQTPFMQINDEDIARLSLSRLNDVWRASITGTRETPGLGIDNGCELYFTVNGDITYYDARIYKGYVEVDYETTDSQRASVDAYMRSMAEALLGNPALSAVVLDEQAYETDGRFALGRALSDKGNIEFDYMLDFSTMKVLKLTVNREASMQYPMNVNEMRSALLNTTRLGEYTQMDINQGAFNAEVIDDKGAIVFTLALPAVYLSNNALISLKSLYGVQSTYCIEAMLEPDMYSITFCTAEAYLNRDKPMISEDAAKAVAIKAVSATLSVPESEVDIVAMGYSDEFDYYEVSYNTYTDITTPWGNVRVNRHTGEPLLITDLTQKGDARYITPAALEQAPDSTPLPTASPTPIPDPTPAPTIISLNEGNGEMLRFNVVYFSMDTESYGEPKNGDVPQGEALELAVRAICEKFDITRKDLEYMTKLVNSSFLIGDTIEGAPCWWFNFMLEDNSCYSAGVSSPDCDVINVYGPEDSNG